MKKKDLFQRKEYYCYLLFCVVNSNLICSQIEIWCILCVLQLISLARPSAGLIMTGSDLREKNGSDQKKTLDQALDKNTNQIRTKVQSKKSFIFFTNI